ncbi:MAG: hypothetical protein WCD42_10365 [Rhizomicrobium sp.]
MAAFYEAALMSVALWAFGGALFAGAPALVFCSRDAAPVARTHTGGV